MQSPPSSILFSVGNFDLHYYGLIMFIAIFAGIFVMSKVAKKYYPQLSSDTLLDILPIIIICAILGARIYYVIMDFSYYAKYPTEILEVWRGGMSIHGGLIGGVAAGIVLSKKMQFSFFKYADVFSFGLLIGQAIGRFGNYFNCEAFGKPCDLPFKLFIPEVRRPLEFAGYEYFHPTFLYETLWNLFVFFVLLYLMRKFAALRNGTFFFMYLMFYSVGRFFIEFLRVDSVLNIGNVPIAQIVSVLVFFVSIIFVYILNFSSKPKQEL